MFLGETAHAGTVGNTSVTGLSGLPYGCLHSSGRIPHPAPIYHCVPSCNNAWASVAAP